MPSHGRFQEDPPPEPQHDCDYITRKLSVLGQKRRFWRPTVKFLLGNSKVSSVLTGMTFFMFLSCAISKRLTVRGFLMPMMLLIIMETATDIADKHVTEVVTMNLALPAIIYSLSMATIMAMVEIYLWSFVIRCYQSCNCER